MHMRATLVLIFSVVGASHVAMARTDGRTKSGGVKIVDKKEAAQVRIPLTMRPHHVIQIRSPQGEVLSQTKPGEELTFTLRAKINQTNHFYFAGYHVESVPVVWKQEMREYGVKLHFYQMSSINSDVEEKVGSLDVDGHLVAYQDKTFNLVTTKEGVFKNPRGETLLSVKAGFAIPGNEATTKAPLISKADTLKAE